MRLIKAKGRAMFRAAGEALMKHTMSILALSAVLSMSLTAVDLRAQAAPSAADLKKRS